MEFLLMARVLKASMVIFVTVALLIILGDRFFWRLGLSLTRVLLGYILCQLWWVCFQFFVYIFYVFIWFISWVGDVEIVLCMIASFLSIKPSLIIPKFIKTHSNFPFNASTSLRDLHTSQKVHYESQNFPFLYSCLDCHGLSYIFWPPLILHYYSYALISMSCHFSCNIFIL